MPKSVKRLTFIPLGSTLVDSLLGLTHRSIITETLTSREPVDSWVNAELFGIRSLGYSGTRNFRRYGAADLVDF